MPKNSYERWTEDNLNSVFLMLVEGKTHAEIAKVMGRSTSSITNVVHRERKQARNTIGKMIMKHAESRQPTLLDRIKRWLGVA